MKLLLALTLLLLPLAGCLDGPLSVDKPGTAEARHPELPGLALRVAVTKVDGGLRLAATLANEGTRTFQASSICVSPWGTYITDDQGRTLSLTAPQAVCAAFGLGPVPPGARLSHNWTWDGNAWEGERGPFRATPGVYTWHTLFTAYTGTGVENQGEARTVDAAIHVRVG